MFNLKLFATLSALLLFTPDAHSQSFSARGVDSSERAEVACLAEVERMREAFNELQELKEKLIDCNEKGEVYPGTGSDCAPLAPLEARWDSNADNPDNFLHFYDGNNPPELIASYATKQGSPGGNKGCPEGYKPAGSNPVVDVKPNPVSPVGGGVECTQQVPPECSCGGSYIPKGGICVAMCSPCSGGGGGSNLR